MLEMVCRTWYKKHENKILNNNFAMAFCWAGTKVVNILIAQCLCAQYNVV